MNMRGFVLSADALFAIFLTAVFIVVIFNVVREDAHLSVKDTFGQDVARLVCEGVSPDQVFSHEQVCGYISVNGNRKDYCSCKDYLVVKRICNDKTIEVGWCR